MTDGILHGSFVATFWKSTVHKTVSTLLLGSPDRNSHGPQALKGRSVTAVVIAYQTLSHQML